MNFIEISALVYVLKTIVPHQSNGFAPVLVDGFIVLKNMPLRVSVVLGCEYDRSHLNKSVDIKRHDIILIFDLEPEFSPKHFQKFEFHPNFFEIVDRKNIRIGDLGLFEVFLGHVELEHGYIH